jgi:hypothetical protein
MVNVGQSRKNRSVSTPSAMNLFIQYMNNSASVTCKRFTLWIFVTSRILYHPYTARQSPIAQCAYMLTWRVRGETMKPVAALFIWPLALCPIARNSWSNLSCCMLTSLETSDKRQQKSMGESWTPAYRAAAVWRKRFCFESRKLTPWWRTWMFGQL